MKQPTTKAMTSDFVAAEVSPLHLNTRESHSRHTPAAPVRRCRAPGVARVCFWLLVALCWAVPELSAATRTKANNTDNLNLASSWTNGIAPGGADMALFESTIAGPLTLALGADLAWNQINFNNPGADVVLSAGNRLTLSNNTPITFAAGTANLTLDCDLYCAGASFTTLPAAPTNRTVTYNGAIQGRAATVTLGNNTGTLRLGSSLSTQIGSIVQITTANLKLGIGASSVGDPMASGPLGTNLFTWGASSVGTELFTYNGDQTLGNPVRIQFGPFNFNSTADLTLTGVVDLNNGNRNFNVAGPGVLRLTGVLSNATGLTKTGPGVLELGGTNVAVWNNGLSVLGGGLRYLTNDLVPDAGGTIRMTNVAHVLDLNGFNDTVKGLTGANGSGNWLGTIDNTAAGTTSVLTVGDLFTYTLLGNLQNSGVNARLALAKIGTGGLIISNANTFRGGLTLASASQVQLNSVGAAGTGPIVFAATDAELNYSGGGSATWTNDITVNDGVRGILSADDGNTLEVAGVISGPGSLWRPNNFSEQGTLILSGDNSFSGGLTLAGGTLILNHPRATGRGTFRIGDPLFSNGSSINVQAGVKLSGVAALTNAVVLNRFFTFGGTNAFELAGPVTLAFTAPQVSINVATPAGVVISGPLGGTGFGINKTGDGLLTLNSVATFDGRLGISTGPLAIGPAGAVPNAADILVGGSGVLDVASAPGFTVGVGQELRGAGTVVGDITVAGELIPNGSIFTFTFSNNLTLTASSTTTMNINRNASPAPEPVVCHGSLQYGGSLVVNNVGPVLQLGDTFDLFGFSGNPGSFANLTLPPLDAGLAWNTSNLGVSGIISVISTGPTPHQLANPQLPNPTNFVLTVSGGTPNGQFRILTHTNVETPVLNWQVLSTNTYDGSGALTVTNLANPTEPRRFFRTVEP